MFKPGDRLILREELLFPGFVATRGQAVIVMEVMDQVPIMAVMDQVPIYRVRATFDTEGRSGYAAESNVMTEEEWAMIHLVQ